MPAVKHYIIMRSGKDVTFCPHAGRLLIKVILVPLFPISFAFHVISGFFCFVVVLFPLTHHFSSLLFLTYFQQFIFYTSFKF